MRKKSIVMLTIFLAFTLVMAGCGNGAEKAQTVKLTYVNWDSEIASTNVAKAVLQEKMGYDVELISVDEAPMWQSVALGDSDGNVASWLPTTSEHYWERFKDEVVDLGPNLEGTVIGLVVPEYVEAESIAELNEYADQFDNRIYGIDPGAGIMTSTEEAMDVYGLNENYELVTSSDAAMTATLSGAIDNEEWIIVTGWTPHWMFASWDLKYLEDPENVFGQEEYINTIVREGLEEDMPEVYAFLDNFYWEPSDMEQVMVWNLEDGADPYENAVRWIEENPEKVESWIPEAE